MSQASKNFADKLNQCLDEMDAPPSAKERASVLSKILDIPKQQALNYIQGLQTPDAKLLQQIAEEFEVDEGWLAS